ncbi:hypothetical protein NPIL_490161 [Nephila pilipes]|uniref:Uncharacterized protein n=1 Tax=Nephila pilipes TaxID=299642 RepID=A0A8X6PAZ0_NEPPI|nr:hypothetical protein NPIL_490161 [Nephila pilipes]
MPVLLVRRVRYEEFQYRFQVVTVDPVVKKEEKPDNGRNRGKIGEPFIPTKPGTYVFHPTGLCSSTPKQKHTETVSRPTELFSSTPKRKHTASVSDCKKMTDQHCESGRFRNDKLAQEKTRRSISPTEYLNYDFVARTIKKESIEENQKKARKSKKRQKRRTSVFCEQNFELNVEHESSLNECKSALNRPKSDLNQAKSDLIRLKKIKHEFNGNQGKDDLSQDKSDANQAKSAMNLHENDSNRSDLISWCPHFNKHIMVKKKPEMVSLLKTRKESQIIPNNNNSLNDGLKQDAIVLKKNGKLPCFPEKMKQQNNRNQSNDDSQKDVSKNRITIIEKDGKFIFSRMITKTPEQNDTIDVDSVHDHLNKSITLPPSPQELLKEEKVSVESNMLIDSSTSMKIAHPTNESDTFTTLNKERVGYDFQKLNSLYKPINILKCPTLNCLKDKKPPLNKKILRLINKNDYDDDPVFIRPEAKEILLTTATLGMARNDICRHCYTEIWKSLYLQNMK